MEAVKALKSLKKISVHMSCDMVRVVLRTLYVQPVSTFRFCGTAALGCMLKAKTSPVQSIPKANAKPACGTLCLDRAEQQQQQQIDDHLFQARSTGSTIFRAEVKT
jgi:hypothetical protein